MAREVSSRDAMCITLRRENDTTHFLREYIMSKEAFVYLWYDAPNDMYYLGKHKGSPDDTYTHSSTIWESFTKDNIPEGVTRRILAYGTDEEMCILEHELLVNRKKRCWNRYYNESLGDPRYVDTSGENNSNYSHGFSVGRTSSDREVRLQSNRIREQMPERIAYVKEYQQTPKYKAYRKEYYQRPEYKEYDKERNATPERKTWRKKYDAERYAKKKAERQGAGTLDAFLK